MDSSVLGNLIVWSSTPVLGPSEVSSFDIFTIEGVVKVSTLTTHASYTGMGPSFLNVVASGARGSCLFFEGTLWPTSPSKCGSTRWPFTYGCSLGDVPEFSSSSRGGVHDFSSVSVVFWWEWYGCGFDSCVRFTLYPGNSFVILGGLLRVNRSRSRTLCVIRVAYVRTVRLVRRLFGIFFLCAGAIILCEGRRFAQFVPNFSIRRRFFFQFLMFRHVIRRVRSRVHRVRFVYGCGEVNNLGIQYGLAVVSFRFRDRHVGRPYCRFIDVGFLRLRHHLLAIRR